MACLSVLRAKYERCGRLAGLPVTLTPGGVRGSRVAAPGRPGGELVRVVISREMGSRCA